MYYLIQIIHIYSWIIVARAVASWLPIDPHHPVLVVLRQATDPVLLPIRKIASPEKMGGLDISPVIAIVLLEGLARLLVY